MRPMLATPGPPDAAAVPTGPAWVHEIKWDGIRVLAEVTGGRVRLCSRTERDITIAFPELAALATAVGGHDDLVLDGEVVAMSDGIPSFLALADRIHVSQARRAQQLARRNPVTYLVFDLLRLDGLDLTPLPLRERRSALDSLELSGAAWQVPPNYPDGRSLMAATREQGLEGVVSKRIAAPYRPGRRSPDWLKFPHRPTESWVVGGWRPETGSARLGSLLLGQPVPEGLLYRGKIGSGLAGRAGATLLEVLRPLRVDASPFLDEVPRGDARGATWVRPQVVVDLDALGVTGAGRLRQPSYRGMRADLEPRDLIGTATGERG